MPAEQLSLFGARQAPPPPEPRPEPVLSQLERPKPITPTIGPRCTTTVLPSRVLSNGVLELHVEEVWVSDVATRRYPACVLCALGGGSTKVHYTMRGTCGSAHPECLQLLSDVIHGRMTEALAELRHPERWAAVRQRWAEINA